MASLVRQLRLDDAFAARPDQTARRFTLIVPTNAAWEKAQLDFSKAYNTLVEGQFPNYVSTESGTRCDTRFCHKFSGEFHRPVELRLKLF